MSQLPFQKIIKRSSENYYGSKFADITPGAKRLRNEIFNKNG
jgi:hypothetical protein